MPQTKLIYLSDPYIQTTQAKIVAVKKRGNQTSLILDQTIFYPQGGGQPSDLGTIKSTSSKLQITQVTYNQGSPLHFGKTKDQFKKGDKVTLILDWKRRFYNMRLHTAGHIIHEAVMQHAAAVAPIKGMHGISGKLYLKYKGIVDKTLINSIQKSTNEIVNSDLPIYTRKVSLKKLKKLASWIPDNLPADKPLRIIQIKGFDAIPDGGTQLKSTNDAGLIKITDIDYDNGHSIIYYHIKFTYKSQKPQLNKSELTTSIPSLQSKALTEINTSNQKDINALQIKYLGRKGIINHLTQQISSIPSQKRAHFGKQLNILKNKITQALNNQILNAENQKSSWLDITAPGTQPTAGHLHPISRAINQIAQIFTSIGFTRVRYPEIDWDYYIFKSLNMPANHPARDEWETFFIDLPPHPKKGLVALTTHTSNGQVREMERVKKPPIRMINIAKCYRRQQDATHTSMFHQFEGLVIDKNINIQHLKGTLDYFAQKFYGPHVKSRIRPFMFKFTEPSFEVDFSCTNCSQKGCRFCKSGWHEVGGAGMVHPNVLSHGNIDPNKYTGFAFGWGVERAYTLKPGLHLDDIRPFYSNNLEFLNQF